MTKQRFITAIGGGLTTLTLLLLAGSAYGATPTLCTTSVAAPNGLAASQGKLFATSQLSDSAIYLVDCPTNSKSLFATLPAPPAHPGVIFEIYMAVAPGGATQFPANFVYAVRGNKVFQIDPSTKIVSTFADFTALGIPPLNVHDGITFDHTGAYGNNMIVSFETGGIYTVDHLGNIALLRQLTPNAFPHTNVTEGPDVSSAAFTTLPNRLLITQEDINTVWTIPPGGASQAVVTGTIVNPESVHFVPLNACALTGTTGTFFTTHYNTDSIFFYTVADVSPFAGQALIPLEGGGIKKIDTAGIVGDFDAVTHVLHEGSTFVDCTIAPPIGADGRMTGGGSVFATPVVIVAPVQGAAAPAPIRVTHGFELHCDVTDSPNRLEINWDGGNNFHLENLISASCTDDPNINSGHPRAPFNTYVGHGTGKLNGVDGATADWTFTDAGEPGSNDTAAISIKDVNNVVVLTVLTQKLDKGNQQAHIDNK